MGFLAAKFLGGASGGLRGGFLRVTVGCYCRILGSSCCFVVLHRWRFCHLRCFQILEVVIVDFRTCVDCKGLLLVAFLLPQCVVQQVIQGMSLLLHPECVIKYL